MSGHLLRPVGRWNLINLLLIGLSIFILAGAIQAQQADDVNVSVSPQIFEIDANPGDTNENVIRLTNNSAGALEITAEARDITPEGEEGAYIPVEERTTYSLASWITLLPDGAVIPPGQTQDFTLTIDFPSDAEPGGHFATAVFTTVPPPADTEGSSAVVQQELALPVILARVSGDIVESAELVEFTAAKSFWTNEDSIEFETRLENTGNVHFKPRGEITIKNMFGSEVAKIQVDSNNVLPDYIRLLGASWDDVGFEVGRYTADLSLVYGDDDNIITDSTSFTIFPYQTVLPATLILFAVAYLLIKFRSRVAMALKVLTGRN